jgi:hypothetical protein
MDPDTARDLEVDSDRRLLLPEDRLALRAASPFFGFINVAVARTAIIQGLGAGVRGRCAGTNQM